MSPLTEPTRLVLRRQLPVDSDAAAYIAAVEAADTAAGSPGGLESGVKFAITNFVLCCKQDGIWNAIKASCILAGARTLSGALVPLVGTAPTNFNFVSGDYNRKTGLIGDGSTKYLNSNRNNNADPQNSCHISVYGTAFGPTNANPKASLGRQINGYNEKVLFATTILNSGLFSVRCQSQDPPTSHTAGRANGLTGASRNNSSTINIRNNNATVSASQASSSPSSSNLFVFASSNGTLPNDGGTASAFDDSRLAFYSIGESLDLAKLDARVTALINAFGAAIP